MYREQNITLTPREQALATSLTYRAHEYRSLRDPGSYGFPYHFEKLGSRGGPETWMVSFSGSHGAPSFNIRVPSVTSGSSRQRVVWKVTGKGYVLPHPVELSAYSPFGAITLSAAVVLDGLRMSVEKQCPIYLDVTDVVNSTANNLARLPYTYTAKILITHAQKDSEGRVFWVDEQAELGCTTWHNCIVGSKNTLCVLSDQ